MNPRLLILAALIGLAPNAAAQQGTVQLTRSIQYYNPAWRPDGKALVFESTLPGVYSIYTINLDGTGLTRLTPDSANNEQAHYSPNGARIVFSSDRAGHTDLYLMDADGSGVKRLTTTASGAYYQSSFSPDGRWIVFQGRPDNTQTRDRLYLISSDGSGMRQLTDSTYGAEGPAWSRDGRTIAFLMVPYPKLHWSEMTPADFAAAKAGTRRMSIRPDGTHLEPAPLPPARDTAPTEPSPDGKYAAYTQVADGWSGLYVLERSTGAERLLTGGPDAGPLGYLRSATLAALQDTLDTYISLRGGAIQHDQANFVVRVIKRAAGRRFEVSDAWHDSTGQETSRQTVRTRPGTVATEQEIDRSPTDSASMLVTPDHATAWVVPSGKPPRLFDAATPGERYIREIVMSAIARRRPAVGETFLAPVSALYGPDPVHAQVDTVRVVRRDTLMQGTTPFPVLVLGRSNGGQAWMDEATGAELLSRGPAGPERWWWHIRRGVSLPTPRD